MLKNFPSFSLFGCGLSGLGIPCVVEGDIVSLAELNGGDKLTPTFTVFALESPQVLGQGQELGAGAGLKHMVIKSIKALQIPVPSLDVPEMIAAEITQKLAEPQKVIQALDAQLAEINQLPAALLSQALSGET
jgi:hypothetical protein